MGCTVWGSSFRASFLWVVACLLFVAPELPANTVAVGAGHVCALTPTGGVRCMGDNSFGELGDGTHIDRLVPIDVTGLTSGVQAVAAGMAHTCALLQNGQVWCWGYNYTGELGLGGGSPGQVSVPKYVMSGVTQIAAGYMHTCAVLATGGVACWGRNDYGQIGDGTTNDQFAPIEISLAGGNDATSLALGFSHSCARTTASQVQCWGSNDFGELGRNTVGQTAPYAPNTVGFLGGVPNDGLTAGDRYTCAITNGSVRCWGHNSSGQLGTGDHVDQTVPTQVANLNGATVWKLAAGISHMCAETSTDVRCWGDDHLGQLGNGGFTSNAEPGLVLFSQGFGTSSIASLDSTTCVLSASGILRCWGVNDTGQFGIGMRGFSNALTPSATLVGSSVHATSISSGGRHTCAITSANDMQCWGADFYGEIGDAQTNTFQPTPKQVAGGSLSASTLSLGRAHTCAVSLTNNEVKCWGHNDWGQLGDGTANDRSSPASVLKKMNASVLTASLVAAGEQHSCSIDLNGKVWCWGSNSTGQLGDGGAASQIEAIPVALSGGGTALGIAAGANHTCIVHDDVQCWGDNSYGQVGISGVHDTPVVVPLAGGNPIANGIIAGRRHTCALTGSGSVQCWGDNSHGQLGQGDQLAYQGPVPLATLNSAVTALASSPDSDATCALSIDGNVWCWGYLSYDVTSSAHLGHPFRLTPTPTPLVIGGTGKATAIAVGTGYVCIVTPAGDRQCAGDNTWGEIGNGEHGVWPIVDDGVDLSLLSQAIQFTSNPAFPVQGGPQYHVMAEATSALPVILTIDVSAAAVCSIDNGYSTDNGYVSFQKPGTCIINADQPGDSKYGAAATATQKFSVGSAPTKLEFKVQPTSTVTAGAQFGVVVDVEDASGNKVSGDNSNITVTVTAPAPNGATLAGTTTKSATAGSATFGNLSIAKAGMYTITATDGALTSAVSTSFTVVADEASKIVFTTHPESSMPPDYKFGVLVYIEDANDNVVSSYASNVTIKLTSPNGAVLNGVKTQTAAGGAAIFTDLSVDKPGVYTLTASDGLLADGVSNQFVIFGAASKLAFTLQPASFLAGESIRIDVSVVDSVGNVVAGDNSTQISLSTSRCGGTVLGVATAIQGIASFSGISMNTPGVALTLHAASNPVLASADSKSFDVMANPPFRNGFEACTP